MINRRTFTQCLVSIPFWNLFPQSIINKTIEWETNGRYNIAIESNKINDITKKYILNKLNMSSKYVEDVFFERMKKNSGWTIFGNISGKWSIYAKFKGGDGYSYDDIIKEKCTSAIWNGK